MLIRKCKAQLSDQHGTFLTLFAVTFVFFIAFSALAIDLGTVYVHKERLQNVADAAALAGASQLTETLTTANCTIITDKYVATYTTRNTGTGVDQQATYVDPSDEPEGTFSTTQSVVNVTALYYNAAADDATGKRRLTVELRQRVPVYFLRYFGFANMPISVTATGRFTPDFGGGSGSGATAGNPFDYMIYASESFTDNAGGKVHYQGPYASNLGLDISVNGNTDLKKFIDTHANGSTATLNGNSYNVILANTGDITINLQKNVDYVIISLTGNITVNLDKSLNAHVILYAPNGTITINDYGNNIWGSMVAKSIVINNSTTSPKNYNYKYIGANPFPTMSTATTGSVSLEK